MGEPLAVASARNVPDVIAPDLDVVFVGVNPGLRSGAVGHHFAHPSSRFWKALHASGFTTRMLSASKEAEMLGFGLGLTNLVDRTTPSARDLHREELREGARRLEAKAARYRPRWVAVLGIGAYRTAFDRPEAQLGPQSNRIAISSVWVLPGPSGLNAHYPISAAIEAFRRFRQAVFSGGSTST
jgi:double-stranded uracil-DNA glycosylase